MTPADFLDELRARLNNQAVPDSDLLLYITKAMRSVRRANYRAEDYIEQVLDTACLALAMDNKFPEVQSVSQGGATISLASNDPERWRRAINGRRAAALVGTTF